MSRPLVEFEIKKNGAAAQTVHVNVIENKELAVQGKAVIVSMIGQSRYGKSSFLNCLTSVITKKNMACFKSMSIKESKACDVTKGMQYYQITTADTRYIIVDVQGIAGTQSEIDPALLMYCYFISDIIVVNCGKTLDTSVLKMLEPISTLRTKINTTQPNRPNLIFRLMDVDDYDNDTAKQCFSAMMTDRDDQVHGVRLCLRELFTFDEVPVIYTERPDKADIRLLDSGEITKFLSQNETFSHACLKIFNRITESKWRTTADVQKFLHEQAAIVNENSGQICASTFDVTSRTTQEDIMEWIHGTVFTKDNSPAVKSNVPDELKTPIGISTCHTDDYKKVLSRKDAVNMCFAAYNERFRDAPSDTFKQGREALNEIIMRPLEAALEICRVSSWKEFEACLHAAKSLMETPFDLVILDEVVCEENKFFKKISDMFQRFGYKTTAESEFISVRAHIEKIKTFIIEKVHTSACHDVYKREIIEQHLTKFIEAMWTHIRNARDKEMKIWSEHTDESKKRYETCCENPFGALQRDAHRLDMSFCEITAGIEHIIAFDCNLRFSSDTMLKMLRTYTYCFGYAECTDITYIPALCTLNPVVKYCKLSTLKKILNFDYEACIARLHSMLEQQRYKFEAYRREHLDELIAKLVEEKKIPKIADITDDPTYKTLAELATKINENGFSVFLMPRYVGPKLRLLRLYIDVFKIRSKKEFERVTSLEVRTLLQQYYVAQGQATHLLPPIKNKPTATIAAIAIAAEDRDNILTEILYSAYDQWANDILLGRIQL